MRTCLPWAVMLAFVPLTVAVHIAAQTNAPAKKQSPKTAARKSTAKKSAAKKSTAKKGAATASKKGRKPARRQTTTWRNRQAAPSTERYKEIQSALAAKGYLPQDGPTGEWNQASIDALKRFQSEQNLEPTGKLNSLSLIALGLGPKYESKAVPPPPAAQTQSQPRN